MAYAEGSRTYYAYKEEGTPNTEESGSGGTTLRRITGELKLPKAKVTSAEKRPDFQKINVLHGTRSPTFSITGPLVGNDYAPLIGAALRKPFASGGASTGTFTITSGVLIRATGSFLTDGVKVGDVRRLAAMTTTGNLGRNCRVTSMASDGLSCHIIALDGGDPIADDSGTNASATFNMPGKISSVPSTGHTSKTFTVEKYDGASETSQVMRGGKVGTVQINAQPDQEATIQISGMGVDRRNENNSTPVLTSPAAAGTGAEMSAGIGFVRVNGVAVAAITGLALTMELGLSGLPVDFGNVSPDIFYGRQVDVTGSINVARNGNDLSDIYDQENEVELDFYIAAPGSEPRAFISVYLGRTKFFDDGETDPDGPVIMTIPFEAMKDLTGTGHDLTTIRIQDSSAT